MEAKATEYLAKLCIEISDRCVGSPGNRVATEWFAERIGAFGFSIEKQEFDCLDWDEDGADLELAGESFVVFPSFYTNAGDITGRLTVATSVEELEQLDSDTELLLLRGNVAAEPLMPKAFVFYNPEEHQKIYRLLEEKKPRAIITATARHPTLAGGNYPCPMIEDGEFDIPSVYLTEEEGSRLADFAGTNGHLSIRARRQPAGGCNVVARKGNGRERIIVCAHIDAKKGTPGATDNATGVATLLLLAERLQDYSGNHTIEIVALNGEDYYSVPGQMLYLAENEGHMKSIRLAINMDGAGYTQGPTAWSLYGATEDLESTVRQSLSRAEGLVEGPPWYQSDHSIFVQAGRPALAFTSLYIQEHPDELFSHTPKDHPREVAPSKLVDMADAILAVLRELSTDLDGGSYPPV